MPEILRTPVTGPSAWKAADFLNDDSWIFRLTPAHLAELNGATRALKARGIGPLEFTKADFPLPALGAELARILHEIEYGRGFVLLRGLNVADYDLDTLKVLYWGLGTHLGQIISQNSQGDLLGVVTDMESGQYAKGWIEENATGRKWFEATRKAERAHIIEKVGADLRALMPFLKPVIIREEEVVGAGTPRHG